LEAFVKVAYQAIISNFTWRFINDIKLDYSSWVRHCKSVWNDGQLSWCSSPSELCSILRTTCTSVVIAEN
jgi:hypothetical protein